jgi:hypothetical protein
MADAIAPQYPPQAAKLELIATTTSAGDAFSASHATNDG